MKLEEAVVHLARLGMKGDVPSVSRLVRRLLKDFADDGSIPYATKTALADLVTTQAAPSPLRFAEPRTVDQPAFLKIELDPAVDAPLLSVEVERQIESIVTEHSQTESLARVNLAPTRSLLLTGPPGVGKTLTARTLARRLELPLYVVDLSALMSSYLGKTGQNLTDVFAVARSAPSVLLLDEFDALAKRRDDPSDVGELKRIVNVLLLELEAWPSTGLIVAATNHPELLDRAIWRRFEKVIAIGVPDQLVRRALILRELRRLADLVNPSGPSNRVVDAVVAATAGCSCSDIVGIVKTAVRRMVLEHTPIDTLLSDEILERLRVAASREVHSRVLFCQVASTYLGMSQRAIGEQLGISHVMVSKLLRSRKRPTTSRRNKAIGGRTRS